jgi:hypothetical protein
MNRKHMFYKTVNMEQNIFYSHEQMITIALSTRKNKVYGTGLTDNLLSEKNCPFFILSEKEA